MLSKPPRKRTPLLLLILAGAAIAICLFLPLIGKYRRFPFTGEWEYYLTQRDGSRRRDVLIFTKEGQCFRVFGDRKRVECTYTMLGSSAIITDSYNYFGNNQLTGIVNFKATPDREGEVIYLEPFSFSRSNKQTGKEVPFSPQEEA